MQPVPKPVVHHTLALLRYPCLCPAARQGLVYDSTGRDTYNGSTWINLYAHVATDRVSPARHCCRAQIQHSSITHDEHAIKLGSWSLQTANNLLEPRMLEPKWMMMMMMMMAAYSGSSQRRFLCESCIRGDGEPVVTGCRKPW